MDAPWPLIVLTGAVLAVLIGQPWWVAWRRRRAAERAPTAWLRRVVRRHVPLVRGLSADLRRRLLQRVPVFMAEKPVIGCQGLTVTDTMRACVAAHALLLTLNRPDPMYPGLRQILLYPGSFAVSRTRHDAAGVTHTTREALAGESWQQGQVILSWADVAEGARNRHDGRNVALHEFAHQLAPDGTPPDLPISGATPVDADAGLTANTDTLRQGGDVWTRNWRAWRARRHWGKPSVIDDYAQTDVAEFFAVATEAYFERPQALAAEAPELAAALRAFYRLDMAHGLVVSASSRLSIRAGPSVPSGSRG